MAFSEAHHWGFSLGTPVSSPSSSVYGSAKKTKATINAMYALSNLITELSLHTTWQVKCHVARDSARCVP